MLLKKITFLFFFLAVILSAQDLTATQKLPDTIIPGADFVVEISLTKTAETSFAKFFQEMPANYTPSEIDSKAGNFTFADNGAKIVWLSLPAED